MANSITLNLPDKIMEKVEETAVSLGRNVETLLEEWISQRVYADDVMTVLTRATSLPIYSGEKTAQALWEYLQETNDIDESSAPGED
jgi:hypothetical protein